MEKYITTILELNKKLYLDKTINNTDYKKDLISCLQSLLLDYNMFMQIESHNILHKFTNINNIFDDNDDNDLEIDNDDNDDNDLEIDNDDNDDNDLEIDNDVNDDNDLEIDNDVNDDKIDKEQNDIYNFDNDLEIDNDDKIDKEQNAIYNFDNESLSLFQCCARLGVNRYNVNLLYPEFLDSYPADTYIDDEGYVFGDSCSNKVEQFSEDTNFFCNSHKLGYEDIRKKPNFN